MCSVLGKAKGFTSKSLPTAPSQYSNYSLAEEEEEIDWARLQGPCDINISQTWTSELHENPQWLWMSHQWIAANRVPETTRTDLEEHPFQMYVRDVQNEENAPGFKITPFGENAKGKSKWKSKEESWENGPGILDWFTWFGGRHVQGS